MHIFFTCENEKLNLYSRINSKTNSPCPTTLRIAALKSRTTFISNLCLWAILPIAQSRILWETSLLPISPCWDSCPSSVFLDHPVQTSITVLMVSWNNLLTSVPVKIFSKPDSDCVKKGVVKGILAWYITSHLLYLSILSFITYFFYLQSFWKPLIFPILKITL